jgi:hypothetical protein
MKKSKNETTKYLEFDPNQAGCGSQANLLKYYFYLKNFVERTIPIYSWTGGGGYVN